MSQLLGHNFPDVGYIVSN